MAHKRKSHLREITGIEKKLWRSQKQGAAVNIIHEFLFSKMEMAEVNLSEMPEPTPKAGSKPKSTKLDSFASSFYAWKKRKSTKQKLTDLGADVILIRRGNKIALKKTSK